MEYQIKIKLSPIAESLEEPACADRDSVEHLRNTNLSPLQETQREDYDRAEQNK